MSESERGQNVGSFIDGYSMASDGACHLIDGVFEPSGKALADETRRANMTPLELCLKKMGDYPRIGSQEDPAHEFDAYTAEITALYQRYPDQRDIPWEVLLLHLIDGKNDTVEQLHKVARVNPDSPH